MIRFTEEIVHRLIKNLLIFLLVAVPVFIACDGNIGSGDATIELPAPRLQSSFSIEEALAARRSVRQYKEEPLSLQEISQLLWSAQGITLPARGYRTAPSAGGTFPLYIYLIASDVTGLQPGFYLYHPAGHKLQLITDNDKREKLAGNGVRQGVFRTAPASIVITADFERTTPRYRDRGIRYVHNEVGHASQNIHLQAEALGLGTVVIGSFTDDQVKQGLNLPDNIDPLYIMPVGKK